MTADPVKCEQASCRKTIDQRLSQFGVVVGLYSIKLRWTIPMNKSDPKIPTNTDAYYEVIASQEEIYLEETEEELRANLISDDPSPHNATAECWRTKREELELGWMKKIDDRRKE